MERVRVSEGVLEGEVLKNEYGGLVYSFKGIPYAESPLGDLRFKAPQPPKPWEGVRSAKEFGSPCYQTDIFLDSGTTGTEDCLYLNVYTPDIKPSKPLPVMFFIHGGGFMCGSGEDDFYGPEFLIRQDVILVTFNYRLEVLGFLCLDTENVPGNAGFKDQVQALRWVQKNISSFGGDPDNVTIFGQSVGGASVGLFLISPMTKGLFKRAIAQSGAATCPWVQTHSPRERAFALGRKLGLYTDDVEELYKFLQKQPVEALANVQVPILLSEKAPEDIAIYFNLVDEKQFGNQERFYYGNIFDNLKSGIHDGVDIITGFTSHEGMNNLGNPEKYKKKTNIAKNFSEYFVPTPLKMKLPIEKQLEMGEEIRRFYFKNRNITVDDWESFLRYHSLTMFVYGTIQTIRSYARLGKTNIYLYQFTCQSERNIMAQLFGTTPLIKDTPVASHVDDLLYLFNARSIPKKVDPASQTFKLVDRITKLWTNFAKHGNPTPDASLGAKWPSYTLQNKEYLDIGNDFVPRTDAFGSDIQFWDEIISKYAPEHAF